MGPKRPPTRRPGPRMGSGSPGHSDSPAGVWESPAGVWAASSPAPPPGVSTPVSLPEAAEPDSAVIAAGVSRWSLGRLLLTVRALAPAALVGHQPGRLQARRHDGAVLGGQPTGPEAVARRTIDRLNSVVDGSPPP